MWLLNVFSFGCRNARLAGVMVEFSTVPLNFSVAGIICFPLCLYVAESLGMHSLDFGSSREKSVSVVFCLFALSAKLMSLIFSPDFSSSENSLTLAIMESGVRASSDAYMFMFFKSIW